MKDFIALALALLVAGSAAFAPASAYAAAPASPLDQATTDCLICDFDMITYDGPLTEAEIVGLLRALNEEYLAWSTYDQAVHDLRRAASVHEHPPGRSEPHQRAEDPLPPLRRAYPGQPLARYATQLDHLHPGRPGGREHRDG
jgi:hypothetical protein